MRIVPDPRAQRDLAGTMALVLRAHRVLLTLSAVTFVGAMPGAHGMLY